MEQIVSYKTTYFNSVTTISYAFSPAVNKIWPTVRVATVEIHHSSPYCAHIHWLISIVDEYQWITGFFFFLFVCLFVCFVHGGNQWHTFAPHAVPYQMPFCQTVPLLPSVLWQQNVMEYWWEGATSAAIPPTSSSDVMGQNNKIESIGFGAALVQWLGKS